MLKPLNDTTAQELYQMYVETLYAISYKDATGKDGDWICETWPELQNFEKIRWVMFAARLRAAAEL